MFYGWKYEGKRSKRHVIYFYKDGIRMIVKFFDTKQEALDFIAEWQEKVEKLEP